MKEKSIKIEGIEYKLRLGFGTMMLFEENTGKDITGIKSKNDIVQLAYAALYYSNENFTYTLRHLIDNILDENPKLFIELIKIITELLFPNSGEVSNKKKV